MANEMKVDFVTFNKVVEDTINDSIENDPVVKQCYEDQGGCFKNIIIPSVINSNDKLRTMISMLASQAVIYDKLLNNIAQYGDKNLIDKCNSDINSVFACEE